MVTIHCDIHNNDILIYENDEEELFIDDNRKEVAIFKREDGTKYLKRYVLEECNENCQTVISALQSD